VPATNFQDAQARLYVELKIAPHLRMEATLPLAKAIAVLSDIVEVF
jgi:hypothetical protein